MYKSLVIGVVCIIIIIMNGKNSFGSRCNAYFPEQSIIDRDRCVEDLTNGLSLDELKIKYGNTNK